MGAERSSKTGQYLRKRRIASLKRTINGLIKRRRLILDQLRREGYYITTPGGARRVNPLVAELKNLWRVSQSFLESLNAELEASNDANRS